MTWQDAQSIAEIIRMLFLPAIGYVAWVVRDIRTTVNKINGRVRDIEAWKEVHDQADERRFQDVERHLVRIDDRHEPK